MSTLDHRRQFAEIKPIKVKHFIEIPSIKYQLSLIVFMNRREAEVRRQIAF